MWAEASPLTHVADDADIPPHLLVRRGTVGRQRTPPAVRRHARRGRRRRSAVVDGTGLTHADVNTRIGAPGDTVMTPPLDAFLAGLPRRAAPTHAHLTPPSPSGDVRR